jgi:hypothetical protein
MRQGILTEEEGSGTIDLPETNLSRAATFNSENFLFLFHKTSYLSEEVSCTAELSPSVRVP